MLRSLSHCLAPPLSSSSPTHCPTVSVSSSALLLLTAHLSHSLPRCLTASLTPHYHTYTLSHSLSHSLSHLLTHWLNVPLYHCPTLSYSAVPLSHCPTDCVPLPTFYTALMNHAPSALLSHCAYCLMVSMRNFAAGHEVTV
jgi:hypothetical protein